MSVRVHPAEQPRIAVHPAAVEEQQPHALARHAPREALRREEGERS